MINGVIKMLKQGNVYFVPWSDILEWKNVKEKILSDDVKDLIRAYEIILMWKVKCNNLPAYIDCTAGLLQVMIQEYLMGDKGYSSYVDYDLRLSYSTALIRFVNHVNSVKHFKSDSFYRLAKIQNIPDWIITMRHDAAHGRNLPELETLHMASEISLQWLMNTYWFKEESYMSDFVPSERALYNELSTDKMNLKPIFKLIIAILKVCFNLQNSCLDLITNMSSDQFSQIQNLYTACTENTTVAENVKGSLKFFRKCIETFENHINTNSCGNLKINSLKSNLINLIKNITRNLGAQNSFILALLQSDFMTDIVDKEWEEIINLMQEIGCFGLFMRLLFQFASDHESSAIKMLQKLIPSIESLRRKWAIYQELLSSKDSDNSEKQKQLKKKAEKKDTFQYDNLVIKLLLKKPPKITLEILQDLLLNPSNYPSDLILKYFNMVEPPLPKCVRENVENLIKLYFGLEQCEQETDEEERIFSVEDLYVEIKKKKCASVEVTMESESWVKSEIGIDTWSKCPIGLLPNRATIDCSLPEDMKWTTKKSVSSRKRSSTSLVNHIIKMKKSRKH